jgi:hypothetical protein
MVASSQQKGNHMITNLDRANWADKAILVFREQTGCDHEDGLSDLLGDLMHWAAVRKFDFDAALDRARHHYAEECEEENLTDRLPEAVRNLIDAFEEQTERARAVIESWEQGDLAGAVHGLELSLDLSLAAIAKVKGGAA